MLVIFLLSVFTLAACNPAPAVDSFKNQYCTDPRTMRRHAAYTEWADAYSCSRHRCQPGGRNLAIYTVGCKRVEAPESAIECEEVVEDTNMQFPYCCTRLRCLVVVRGEVWTRVLGQPWETLPAAPWSHMYKMKKPPPGDTSFLPKNPEQGPIYELSEKSETAGREKSLRASNVEPKETTECPDCNEISMRASDVPVPSPDIVIALTTSNDQKEEHTAELRSDRPDRSDRADRPDRPDGSDRPDRPDRSDRPDRPDRSDRRKRKKQKETTSIPSSSYYEEEKEKDVEFQELEEIMPIAPEKPIQQTSEEKMVINTVAQTPKTKGIHNRWSEDLEDMDGRKEDPPVVDVHEDHDEKREEKPSNLQALVDAIGTRMKDIENVVQRMSEKVTKTKPEDGSSADKSHQDDAPRKHHKSESKEHGHEEKKIKKYTGDSDYKRFTVKDRGSKYLRTSEFTTEGSLFLEEHNMNGYYQDASSTLLRRSGPKEPAQTYMAPVETRRQRPHESSETTDKKKKKHHKKKKSKHGHKKHHKEEKKKKFNKSVEEKNIVSLEDSNSAITK